MTDISMTDNEVKNRISKNYRNIPFTVTIQNQVRCNARPTLYARALEDKIVNHVTHSPSYTKL